VDFSIGINGLELDLFDSTRRISNSSFLENFFCTSTDAGVSGIDVVVEYLMSFMTTIRNSNISDHSQKDCTPGRTF
jgi:hypothetical protein